jgi:hypothetical protein
MYVIFRRAFFFRIYFSNPRVFPESIRLPRSAVSLAGPFHLWNNLRRDLYRLDFHGPSREQWIPKASSPRVLRPLTGGTISYAPRIKRVLALPHLYSEFASTRIFWVKKPVFVRKEA